MVKRVNTCYLENNRLVHTDVVTSYLSRKHHGHTHSGKLHLIGQMGMKILRGAQRRFLDT